MSSRDHKYLVTLPLVIEYMIECRIGILFKLACGTQPEGCAEGTSMNGGHTPTRTPVIDRDSDKPLRCRLLSYD